MSKCIVVYNDDDAICVPMCWDPKCEGAIEACGESDHVALFDDEKSAKKAIRISTRYAMLCREQGKIVNADFIGDSLKNVKVMKCEAKHV